MRNWKLFLLLFFIAPPIFNPDALFADTLILTNGQKIEGKIIKKTDTFIRIEENGIPVTYFTEEISRVIETPLNPAADDASSANTTPAVNPLPDTGAITAANPAEKPVDTKNIDPGELDRAKLTSIIENFFLHRNDQDPTQALTNVTDEFKKVFLSAVANRGLRREKDNAEIPENFKMEDLVLNADSTITASVSFDLSASFKSVEIINAGSGWKINNITNAQGDSWAENPDNSAIPDYAKITGVIENFFLHQSDKDLTQCFTSVTDEFKKIRQTHLEKRRIKDIESPVFGIKNFKVFTMDLNGDTGIANVSFNSGPVTVRVMMKKEGGDWKVHSLINGIKGDAPVKSP